MTVWSMWIISIWSWGGWFSIDVTLSMSKKEP